MDPQMLGRLLCAAKTPLGSERVLEAIVQSYKQDLRAFAADTYLHRHFEPVPPTERCKKKVGRGRCRQPASKLSIAQLCSRHCHTEANDSNLIGMCIFRNVFRECGDPGLENLFKRRS